jgi:hypothetical protein
MSQHTTRKKDMWTATMNTVVTFLGNEQGQHRWLRTKTIAKEKEAKLRKAFSLMPKQKAKMTTQEKIKAMVHKMVGKEPVSFTLVVSELKKRGIALNEDMTASAQIRKLGFTVEPLKNGHPSNMFCFVKRRHSSKKQRGGKSKSRSRSSKR